MATNNNDSLMDTITPKSDQLNADDLVAGPITVKVTAVKRGDTKEQPVIVSIDGGHRPYMPCKSMRRVLIAVWGEMPAAWIGRSMTLYCDPSVVFGGMRVGGIRISHLSDLATASVEYMLTTTRSKRAAFVVKRLEAKQQTPPQQQPAQAHEVTAEGLADLFARVAKHSSTKEEREAIYRGFGVVGPIGKPTSWTRLNIDAGHDWCDQMESGN